MSDIFICQSCGEEFKESEYEKIQIKDYWDESNNFCSWFCLDHFLDVILYQMSDDEYTSYAKKDTRELEDFDPKEKKNIKPILKEKDNDEIFDGWDDDNSDMEIILNLNNKNDLLKEFNEMLETIKDDQEGMKRLDEFLLKNHQIWKDKTEKWVKYFEYTKDYPTKTDEEKLLGFFYTKEQANRIKKATGYKVPKILIVGEK